MRFSRCPLWLLAVLLGTSFGLTDQQSVQAQASLPKEVLQPSAALAPAQKATIDQFVDTQVERLKKSEDPEEVALGRSLLVEQFNLSNSSYFLDSYRESIANRVAPLLDPNGPLMTRLNVAIISAKLSGANLVKILQAGADDPSPAVRYWIAKAVGSAAKAKQLNTAEQRDALDVLARRLKLEESSLVLEQVMLAMSEIQLPEAIQKVLEGLESRIAFHRDNPNAQYRPVNGGMRQLFSKLIGLRAADQNVDKQIRQLARIALLYYSLASEQLAEGAGNEEAENDKANIVVLCRQILEYSIQGSILTAPPSISILIETKNWKELHLTADRWRDILKGPPFNFTDEQLNPKKSEEPEEANE